jgi:hypothetical protein
MPTPCHDPHCTHLCDPCAQATGRDALRQVDAVWLAFLYNGEPVTFVDHAGNRHHYVVRDRTREGIPVATLTGEPVCIVDRRRGESAAGFIDKPTPDHPVVVRRREEAVKAQAARLKRMVGREVRS